jgi:hypothetical protein
VFYLQFFFVSPFRLAKIEIKDFFAVAMQFSRFFTGFESSIQALILPDAETIYPINLNL